MNKKTIGIVSIILLVIAIVGVFYWWVIRDTNDYEYFPPQSTQQERKNAKKLPKDQCPCWDGINNVCLPQADCI